jgi:hypothetical protein
VAETEQLTLPIRGFGTCGYCLRQFQAGERECPVCSPKLALVADIGSYRDFIAEMAPNRRAALRRSRA